MLNTILCLLRIVHGFGYYNEDRWTVFKYHIFCVGNAEHTRRYYLKGRSQKENTGLFGNFSQMSDPPFGNPLLRKRRFILHFKP